MDRPRGPHDAAFVPPPPELVPGLVDDLCEFCNRADVPVAIQAGIAHVQFETIHPFFDGHGRVGRALILIVLRRGGLARSYLPPVSLVLAGEADRYVGGLSSWRRGDEDDWYRLFIDALYRAAAGAQHFVADVAPSRSARWPRPGTRAAARGSAADRAVALAADH